MSIILKDELGENVQVVIFWLQAKIDLLISSARRPKCDAAMISLGWKSVSKFKRAS